MSAEDHDEKTLVQRRGRLRAAEERADSALPSKNLSELRSLHSLLSSKTSQLQQLNSDILALLDDDKADVDTHECLAYELSQWNAESLDSRYRQCTLLYNLFTGSNQTSKANTSGFLGISPGMDDLLGHLRNISPSPDRSFSCAVTFSRAEKVRQSLLLRACGWPVPTIT